jgi:hypothetical protein
MSSFRLHAKVYTAQGGGNTRGGGNTQWRKHAVEETRSGGNTQGRNTQWKHREKSRGAVEK